MGAGLSPVLLQGYMQRPGSSLTQGPLLLPLMNYMFNQKETLSSVLSVGCRSTVCLSGVKGA